MQSLKKIHAWAQMKVPLCGSTKIPCLGHTVYLLQGETEFIPILHDYHFRIKVCCEQHPATNFIGLGHNSLLKSNSYPGFLVQATSHTRVGLIHYPSHDYC